MSSGLYTISGTTDEIGRQLAEERARLRSQAGLSQPEHFRRPVERKFLAHDRDKVTILFGGLTWKHEALIQAVFQGSGYRCENLPVPSVPDFQAGKEYGNNGQCNPTYFTVGNLVRFLQGLESQGVPRQEILDNYVFFTAGSCGPCRFGMYEAEYRFALQNAGFDGFRVLLFQQTDGIKAASGEPGLKFTVDFGMGMLNALFLGDVMNDLAFQVRPYEVNRGETDRVMEETMQELVTLLRDGKRFEILEDTPKWISRRLAKPEKKKLKNTLNTLGKIRDHIYGKQILQAIDACREKIDKIEIDRTRVKPVVKITGEFWAQTTEGDGNFNMFRFLEKEGAQALVEPIGTWIMYMIHQAKQEIKDMRGLDLIQQKVPKWNLTKLFTSHVDVQQKLAKLTVAETIFKREYHKLIDALGGIAHHLTDQYELQRMGHPYYNSRAGGGEGHLEVAKNIYYSNKDLCHMVLSLKPFGCMPSTQSDGAQSAVVSQYKDMIFIPIETSGEGDVNAHSRVQMALGEAKVRAKNEMKSVLEKTGVTLDEVQEFVAEHPEMQRPMYKYGHHKGVVGVAANFVLHAAERMKAERRELVAV